MNKAEQILEKHINDDDLNFIFHENKQLWQELLNAVNEALRQPPVIGSVCENCGDVSVRDEGDWCDKCLNEGF